MSLRCGNAAGERGVGEAGGAKVTAGILIQAAIAWLLAVLLAVLLLWGAP